MSSTTNRVAEKAHEAGSRVSDELDGLKESFAQLRTDMADIVGQAMGLGRVGADVAKDGAHDAVDALKDKLTDLRKYGKKRVSAIEDTIEDNPIPAALIAFGIGFIAAKFFSHRR